MSQPLDRETQLPLADRYRMLARVGIGGTAVVYRCVDMHTGRLVAVKVLRTNGPLIPEAETRFRREALMAAHLSHPNIVRVLDFGYTLAPPLPSRVPWSADDADRPVPYLAMEYVTGSTLKELVRQRGPLPFDWVWRIGEQLCSALAAAHAQQIIHRDVKPQNVLILNSRFELLAKLTDFGIARQIDGHLTTLTASGQVLGTPDYLSPEQVLGEAGGPQSDLYSLGIVLFEMITGRLPFEAETPLAAASRRMIEDAPPVSLYREDIPPPLEQVITASLQREPYHRLRTLDELREALLWSRSHAGPVPTAPPGSWVVAKRTTSQSLRARSTPQAPVPLIPPSFGNSENSGNSGNSGDAARLPTPSSAATPGATTPDPTPAGRSKDEDEGGLDSADMQTTILRVAPIPPAPNEPRGQITLALEPTPLDDETSRAH